MLTNSPRKLWALIGAGGTVAIIALSWVLLISGQRSERADLDSQAADARGQAAIARQKLNAQRADNAKLPGYQAELAKLERALPAGNATASLSSDISGLIRQTHIKLVTFNASPPAADSPAAAAPAPAQPSASGTPTPGATGAPAVALPEIGVTLSVQGSASALDEFLDLLQNKESRALRITSVDQSTADGKQTMTIAATAFKTAG